MTDKVAFTDDAAGASLDTQPHAPTRTRSVHMSRVRCFRTDGLPALRKPDRPQRLPRAPSLSLCSLTTAG